MGYCLPKAIASQFLKALQDGKIEPDNLMEMSSAARRAFFEGIVGKEDAPHVNALFESKLLLKDQQAGLVRWAKSLAGVKEKTRTDMLAKIAKLDKILTPSDEHGFLADLAEQKLGTSVTEDEAKRITELSSKAAKARANPGDNLSGVSDEYIKAASDLRHYVASLKPATALASIGKNLAIIGRNHLLMNPSTPIKTTTGQIINSAMEAFTRRIGALSANGLSGDLVSRADNKEAWATFRATGMNTASMKSIDNSGRLGERSNFDVPEGMSSTHGAVHAIETGVRKYAAATNKVAIDWEHNIPFTKFHQKAFFDMLNVGATNVAKSEGLSGAALKSRADAVFKDAARIEPLTAEGAMIRREGQMSAARVTSTNDTWLSRVTMGMKDGLNGKSKVGGVTLGLPGLGDILMPIAKIPANIIANGIENAGPGIPLGIKDIYQARKKIASEDKETHYEGMGQFSRGLGRLVRTFGALAVGAFLASQLKKSDFREDKFGNGYVRLFGLWFNTEYISAISPGLAGFMNVKKLSRDGDGVLRTSGHYVSGSLQELKRTPGIDEASKLVTSVTDSNMTKGILRYGENFFSSRGVPSFVANLQRDRPVNRLAFGAHGIEDQADIRADEALKRKHARENHAHRD